MLVVPARAVSGPPYVEIVVPAKAGTHLSSHGCLEESTVFARAAAAPREPPGGRARVGLGPRFRGDDKNFRRRGGFETRPYKKSRSIATSGLSAGGIS